MNTENRYISEDYTELHDDAIIKDLKEAVEMYENGELLEIVGILNEIAWAITQWDE